jgi:subtilisin family serine protease
MACIVAAGNDAGPVRFPALSPDVFAVAAIGKQGEYPANSYHATQVAKDTKVTQDGFFSAKFTCFGPEIDVAAPGVGIVSSVPEDTYAAWDGTSMASPHVCGLAALMLAHHPDFKARFKLRSEKRVERLFELIKDSCRALEFGDRNRSGAGLPHAIRALGLAGDGATQPAAAAPPQPGAEREPQAGAPQSVASNGNGRAPSWLDGLRSLLEGAGLLSSGVRVAPMAVDELLVPGLGAVHTASVAQLTVLVQAAGLAEEGASTVEPQTAGDPIAPLTELMTAAGLTTADG